MVKTGKTTRNKEIFAQTCTKKQKSEYFCDQNIKELNNNKNFQKKINIFKTYVRKLIYF